MNILRHGLVIFVGLSLGACAEKIDNAGGQAGGGGGFAMPVEVAVARVDTVVDAIFGNGQIEAIQSIELRPEIAGRLTEILFTEGATVQKGTPLFRIDDAELRAEVAQLEAERDLAEQALNRTRKLLAQEASSEAELELAEANWRSAVARLDLEKVRLERTTIRAPFSGIVGERFVSLGDYITTSTSLATLQTFDPQRAAFEVPERYAQRLAVGQPITFAVAATSGSYEGRVDFVDPVVQLPGRTIQVKAIVSNPRRALLPGMFIEVRLATEERPNAIVVPEDAILPLQGADYVWIVEEAKATRREVTLGVRVPGFVEILEGVQGGDQVVVGGLERLSEGVGVAPTIVERNGA
jgi:membrane fusion protein (multidrug efflux system)